MGYGIACDPGILYLGLIPEDVVGQEDIYLFKILTVAAKKAITKRWLKTHPPREKHWLDIIEDIYVMEKITYNLRAQAEIFEKRWLKWNWYKST